MSYKVIKNFTDLQDNNFPYSVGDEYPRKGVNVLPTRIKELASDKNRQGCPLIEEIPEEIPAEITEETQPNDGKKKKKSAEKADKE